MKTIIQTILRHRSRASLGLALVALFGVPRATAAEPTETNWLKDPISGCAVWAENPTGTEVVSWSGGCADGKASGRGVLSWFKDGKLAVRFEGAMVAGKAQGPVRADFWLHNGYAHYEGEFEDSDLHGRGVLILPDQSRAEGSFENGAVNGYVVFTRTNGASYAGQVKDNKPDGKGRQILADKEEYYGEFKAGKREGQGTLLLTNGDIYKGAFKNDKPDGQGKLLTAEGGVYEGPFKAGQPHGDGVFTTPDGDVARGRVVEGKPDGKIVYTLKNGGTREETWKNGTKVNP